MAADETIALRGRATPADKAMSAYRHLPFDVPAGIARLEVDYRYDNAAGNVLDIGLFDPRGSAFLQAAGFRGWSGSARRAFFVSQKEATPGYLPGPMLPGRWEVILGLYRLAPEGCDYEVIIRLARGPSLAGEARGRPEWPVVRAEPGWYRGDLHCHTHHSDASGSLADLAAAGREQGLDFVAVTDHNTSSHLAHLAAHSGAGLLLVPGIEITTEGGHANAWGVRGWHEFRAETAGQMAQVVAQARSAGAVLSINHPKRFGPPWTYGGETAFDCIEVWQAHWRALNDESLALWERLLRAGQRITAVGGSDAHQTRPGSGEVHLTVGHPCTWIYASELSTTGLLAGLRAGQVFISESPAGPRIALTARAGGSPAGEATMGEALAVAAGTMVELRCTVEGGRPGDWLRICGAGSEVMLPIDKDPFVYRWRVRADGAAYCRVEVVAEPEPGDRLVRALSNPIYLRPGRRESDPGTAPAAVGRYAPA